MEDKNLKILKEMKKSLNKAKLLGNNLDCECDEYNGVICGKHRLVEDISDLEDNIKRIMEVY